jgi:hypothetical protein
MKAAFTEEEQTTMRECQKCHISKPLMHFYRLGDDHEKTCKDCRNDRPNTYLPATPPQPAKKARESGSIGKKRFSAKKSKK